MAQYFLSPQAQRSLIQIADYTAENFGQSQKKKYLTMLRKYMRMVAANPNQGRVRTDIKLGYYSISAGSHHIYYRIVEAGIEIIDVLHESMEPNRHL